MSARQKSEEAETGDSGFGGIRSTESPVGLLLRGDPFEGAIDGVFDFFPACLGEDGEIDFVFFLIFFRGICGGEGGKEHDDRKGAADDPGRASKQRSAREGCGDVDTECACQNRCFSEVYL